MFKKNYSLSYNQENIKFIIKINKELKILKIKDNKIMSMKNHKN